jgi:L-aspartate oxidase
MREERQTRHERRIDLPPAEFPAVSESEIRALAWDYMGISRNGPDLRAAIERIRSYSLQPKPGARLPDYDLRSIHTVAGLIARSALEREESRGAHFRTDFPEKRTVFEKPTILSGQPSHARR